MDNADKNRFAQIMVSLAEDCSATISREGLELKFKALSGYSIEQVEAAVLRVMRENVFTKMPTTGTIINAIEGTMDDRAEYQYTVVLRAIRQLGSYGYPKFKDHVTQSLIDNHFGWSQICSIRQNEMEFFARDFKAAYINQSKESCPAIGYKCSSDILNIANSATKRIGSD